MSLGRYLLNIMPDAQSSAGGVRGHPTDRNFMQAGVGLLHAGHSRMQAIASCRRMSDCLRRITASCTSLLNASRCLIAPLRP
ncbi:hypothetical protein DUNSADRAFT_10242 [Dunaliella salina]|uniref:Encoded protein n=1 Tax=Dunaliella salina TaxID=3046 RepID=A0ABQ7GFS2_DUNSA|nr:hypothetical protein DUNSADRAFT_10242 [Dunaliella salina]|eukprot:KAF5833452.1 hypothetical protein DUNSADRAFT_10242 [Dunaliella salina]